VRVPAFSCLHSLRLYGPDEGLPAVAAWTGVKLDNAVFQNDHHAIFLEIKKWQSDGGEKEKNSGEKQYINLRLN
jgi:hypothetical protein